MDPLKHCFVETAFDGIFANYDGLFALHFKDIFNDIVEESDSFFLLIYPLLVVLLIGET